MQTILISEMGFPSGDFTGTQRDRAEKNSENAWDYSCLGTSVIGGKCVIPEETEGTQPPQLQARATQISGSLAHRILFGPTSYTLPKHCKHVPGGLPQHCAGNNLYTNGICSTFWGLNLLNIKHPSSEIDPLRRPYGILFTSVPSSVSLEKVPVIQDWKENIAKLYLLHRINSQGKKAT